MNVWSYLHSCHLWASLNLCKYLRDTFVFFCATSAMQINLVNNDVIWSVTFSSYCIVLIRIFEEETII